MNRLTMFKKIVRALGICTALLVAALPFIYKVYAVSGDSMAPAYRDGDVMLVERLSYRFAPPGRGEVMVMRNPHKPGEIITKRIVGLPGESVRVGESDLTIRDADGVERYFGSTTTLGGGAAHRNAMEATMNLGPEDYYVLGDNRETSLDSRIFGAAQQADFIGRAAWRLPFIKMR